LNLWKLPRLFDFIVLCRNKIIQKCIEISRI
jgi:hypothetical protein